MTRWTEQQYRDHAAGRAARAVAPKANHRLALGRLPIGKMNKTEAAYDAHLQLLRHAGEILWHKFEGIKLRLADNTFYTADFAVMAKDGVMEIHEIKGFWEDDARVKIKVAASLYPFRFIALKKKKDGWEREEFS